MTITVSGSTITFNDSTTQSTGFSNPIPIANGGTAATSAAAARANLGAGTGNGNGNGNGTVTSVATGNGLQGGTITSSGTLSLACPGFNTVGSYSIAGYLNNTTTAGGNYPGGQLYNYALQCDGNQEPGQLFTTAEQLLSGTWKAMNTCPDRFGGNMRGGLFCRVS